MKATAIHDVLVALVAAFDAAVDYPVFDGPPSKQPDRGTTKWLIIGADEPEPGDQNEATQQGSMSAQLIGLGSKWRDEELEINCVAVGKSTSIAAARAIAVGLVEDASQNMPHWPSANSYGAHVSDINEVRVRNVSGGAIAHIHFIISAKSRLT